MGQRTRYHVRPALLFILAAIADGGIFLGNVEELQPDTDGLKGMFNQMGRNAGSLFRLVNDAQNRGFAQADDLAQEVAEHDGNLVDIGTVFSGQNALVHPVLNHLSGAPHVHGNLCSATLFMSMR
jgi:hypothetical protein